MAAAPDTTLDDLALLEAWRGSDRDAGEALFDRHFDAMYRFFASKIPGDVSDLVQRTFLACVESRDRFRGSSSFRTFLYAIARHELYGYFRAKKRGAVVDFGVSSLAELAPGPSTALRAGAARAAIVAALRAMPLELQLALELRFWEGLTGPELAIALDLPEGTVRSRLRRATEMLRAALANDAQSIALVAGLVGESDEAFDAWADDVLRAR